MKSKILLLALISCVVFVAPVMAREGVTVVNFDNVAIATSSGKPVASEQFKKAVQTAAASHSWTVAQTADGKLLATLVVRNKHTVTVEIAYAIDKYSLHYKDSVNMNYAASARSTRAGPGSPNSVDGNGQPVIHPNYNKWVQTLRDAIRTELIKL